MTREELKKDLIAKGGNLPGVYKITRNSDGKVYIGQTEKPIVERIIQHINNVKVNKNSDSIDRAIQKDGFENFKYEVELFLPHADTDQLWDLESQYIAKYDSYNKGFNLTKGNHVGKSIKNTASYIMHVVKVDLFKKYIKPFNLDFANKSVLLINYFGPKVISHLEFEDCDITCIHNSDFVEDKKGNLQINSSKYGEYIMKELEQLKGKHFDIVISNPPYGAIGANITDKVRETIDYNDFINLLPANDYQRNTDKDLYKYVEISTMKPIMKGFDDAAVTTHVARINKKPCLYISADEFEIENYIDPILKKYFYENRKRTHYAIDNHICKPKIERFRKIDLRKCFYTGKRDLSAGHLPYSKDTLSYKVNFNLLTDHDDFLALSSKSEQALGNSGNYTVVPFKTNDEKDNLIKFLYSEDGFRFISKLFIAINVDCYVVPAKYLPKVDWTRSWTVEEILEDYGYTQDEIKEIMDDLHSVKADGTPKYKGMDN